MQTIASQNEFGYIALAGAASIGIEEETARDPALISIDRLEIPDLKELQGVHVTPEEHGALPPAHRGVSLLGRVFKARPGGQQSWDLPSQHQKSAGGGT